MVGGGKMEVGCADKEGAVFFWVKDTGSGIPPEVLPKIFDYAFTTKGEKGSGLGLSISKQLIENHGGKIAVQSEVGKGTVFTIRIPHK
jgi:signal transduction histidine kinase